MPLVLYPIWCLRYTMILLSSVTAIPPSEMYDDKSKLKAVANDAPVQRNATR